MDSKNEHIDFYNLTAKYLSCDITENEVKLLEKWVKASEENKSLFKDYKQAWNLTLSSKVDFNSEQAWDELKEQVLEEDDQAVIPIHTQKSQWSMVYRIAASVVIFLAIGYVFLYYFNQEKTELLASDKILTETLADGSEVTINQNSTLIHSNKFNKKERKVTLEGEAFFDIARNEEKPFIIETDEITVKVLGTSFYVNARNENPEIKVMVSSGRVEVTTENNEHIVLATGETGTFNKKSQALLKNETRDNNYLSWKTKRLVFENTPLFEVAKVISHTYNVDIRIENPEIEQCRLTAHFENQSLQQVLDVIAETLDLEISDQNGIYVFNGKPWIE